MPWYSTIHSPDTDLPRILSETSRVLRPSGLFLVAFQSGRGVQDVSDNYLRRGHLVVLHRYNRTPREIDLAIASAGLTEIARLERAASSTERDSQAVLIAQA